MVEAQVELAVLAAVQSALQMQRDQHVYCPLVHSIPNNTLADGAGSVRSELAGELLMLLPLFVVVMMKLLILL